MLLVAKRKVVTNHSSREQEKEGGGDECWGRGGTEWVVLGEGVQPREHKCRFNAER